MEEITSTELKQRLDNGEDIQIIDVREDNEYAFNQIPNSVHIPLGQVLARVDEIDPNRETVVHCKMGGRSAPRHRRAATFRFHWKTDQPEGRNSWLV